MLTEAPQEPRSPLKNPLVYTSIALAIAFLYAIGVLFVRWKENRSIEERAAQERNEKQREQDRAMVDQLGGKELTILNFYPAPSVVRRGESTQLCYGVSNAKTVRVEPPVGAVWPSFSRCVDVSPAKTTTYTLTVEDGAGHSKTQSVEIKVE